MPPLLKSLRGKGRRRGCVLETVVTAESFLRPLVYGFSPINFDYLLLAPPSSPSPQVNGEKNKIGWWAQQG